MRLESERPTASALPRVGRCFRTDAEGRIALTNDWPGLLRDLCRAGRIAVQTRHAAARLVTITSLAEFTLRPGNQSGFASDETGVLDFRFATWGRAWGFLRRCECCTSPGRLEVWDRSGGEFLQFCGTPGSDPHGWSDILGATASHTMQPDGTTTAAATSSAALFALPRLSRSHVCLPFHIDALGSLLSAFGDEGLPVRCTVNTADFLHRRDIVPRRVSEHEGNLSAGEPGACVQLACPAVLGLALTSDITGWSLHVTGADERVLLTFSAAADSLAAAIWHGALRAAFPGLH